MDTIDAFRAEIAASGITPPETLHADGALHRYPTDGTSTDDAGWYVLYTNGVAAGAYGCHRARISETWCSRARSDMSPAERKSHRTRMDAIRRDRDAERERRQAEARERVAQIWRDATPETGEHRYLRDKGVQAYGIRTDGHRLLIPMWDTDGTLHSIQHIDPTGGKRYLTGGRVSGCYHAIGRPDGTLCVCEGYATAASVHEATGHAVAVAFSATNLAPAARALRDKYPDLRIVICADDDYRTDGNPGVTAATEAAQAVGGLLAVPQFGVERPDGATDFNDLAQHCGLEAAQQIIANATPPALSQDQPANHAPADDTETFRRLVALSPVEYDRCREREAKALGVRVGTLDDEVTRLRPQTGTDTDAGSAVLFDEPEPWPDPVDGAVLLNALAETLSRYVVLPTRAADALALWAAHTHVYEAFTHTPRLNVKGPDKNCGKSLLLDVLQTLIAKGLITENLSTAVTFRLIDAEAPTLLIDEYDSFLRDKEELRGALNAGQKRGGVFMRCEGDQNKVRTFRTFAPVALAGIGSLPGTLADRSIIIHMQRAKPDEVCARFDSRKTAREQELKRQLIRWAQDNRQRLEAADPELPGLHNRKADTWRPLFAIAQAAGGEWPNRVQKAVTALTDKSDESESAGVLLLADIRQLFETANSEKLASHYLVDRLVEMEERPWPEFRRGKPITARQIASLLRPFGIVSGARREGGTVFRGYELRQFGSAFSRYLTHSSVTALQPAFQSHSDEFSSVTNGADVTHRKTPKPAPHNGCNAVTHKKPGNGAKVWTTPSWTIIPRANSHVYDDAEVF